MGLRLTNGDRVCIVGGGPAGSLAALHLLRLAQQQALRLEVLVFEPRDFTKAGPAGCNRCAGILSSRLIHGLEQLDIALPEDIIQSYIDSYAVHLDGSALRIVQPDPTRRIISVYRGGGPRIAHAQPVAGFDSFLLAQACARGAQHISERVRLVQWADRPLVRTRTQEMAADLLILATGINSRPPLDPVFGYRPPKTAMMAQDEFLLPPSWPDDQVSAFFRHPPGLVFGALIPKGRYLNISLLGNGLRLDSISDFIETQNLIEILGSPAGSLCGCTPRIAISPARRYFGSRWVAIGDAAVTRLYKDGIGSAFFTAKTAMETAVNRGISAHAFRHGYAPHCRQVATDNRYGRLLFALWHLTMRSPRLLRAWKNAIHTEVSLPAEQRIHIRILWGMLTGDEPYRDLFRLSISPSALLGLTRSLSQRLGGDA